MSAQHLTNTAPNRYPDVFRTLRARVAETRGPDLGQGELRILSFGCSVGFEMRTLRAYFPDAAIFGCDTSLDALNRARRNLRDDPGIAFFSTPEAIRASCHLLEKQWPVSHSMRIGKRRRARAAGASEATRAAGAPPPRQRPVFASPVPIDRHRPSLRA